MWPFRSPEQSQPDPSAKGISPFTREHAKSERNAHRFSRFLKVWFVAHMAAYPVREELYVVGGNVPRMVEKALSDRDPEAQAKQMLEQYRSEIESGEPIPVDLLTFYLEQEKESAGVSGEEISVAKGKFEEIIAKAKEIKEKGSSRSEVLGYVLKQQGDYDDSSSLMTDLLVRGKGECEARQRYISAAVQRLYPEDVSAGKMKSETFRPWVDKQGLFHPGHVRVVIDQGERVEVLEGDAVKSDPAKEHVKITKIETTRLAVTGYAAKEGLYDLDEGSRVKPISVTDQVSRAVKGSHKLESAQEALHNALTDNTVAAYPTAATTYGREGVGTRDVDPHPVGDSWAPSRYDWDHAIEFTLVKPYPLLTMENFDRVYNPQSGYFEFEKYDIPDPLVMKKIVQMRNEKQRRSGLKAGTIMIRSDQKLPIESFGNTPVEFSIRNGSYIPKELESISVSKLSLYDVDTIPKNIASVHWTPDATLFMTVAGEGDIDPHHALRNFFGLAHGTCSILIDPMKTVKNRPSLSSEVFNGANVGSLTVSGLTVPSFGTLHAEKIIFEGKTEPGQFQSVGADYLSIQFPENQNVLDLPLYLDDGHGFRIANIKTVEVHGVVYGSEAFSHVPLNTLISRVEGPIANDTFKNTRIVHVVLMQDPFSSFDISRVKSTGVVTVDPYIGKGVGMVVFVPSMNNLTEYDAQAMGKDGKSMPGMTLREQVEFLRGWNLIDSHVSIVVLTGEKHAELRDQYGGFDKIPDSAYLKADYLKGAGNVKPAFERSQ